MRLISAEWTPAGATRDPAEPPAFDAFAAAAWIQAYDAAWLDRDWPRLEAMLAANVESVTPDRGATRIGRAAVLDALRQGLDRATVHEFGATDVQVRGAGRVRVVRYRWHIDFTRDGVRSMRTGEDLLALRQSRAGWVLLRRIQLLS